jgi:hypothetical protein
MGVFPLKIQHSIKLSQLLQNTSKYKTADSEGSPEY